jgi:hypothetical protein
MAVNNQVPPPGPLAPEDLEGPLVYRRARDTEDKPPEVCKLYPKAL